MFGTLTDAFGFTVLCLAPIQFVSLLFPPIIMRLTRPPGKTDPKTGKKKPGRRNPIVAFVSYTGFYLLTLVTLTTITMAFWWVYLTAFGTESAIDFAAQSLPFERDVVEDVVATEIVPTVPSG